ncbi:MAG TPA: lipid-transfer protein [Gemmatimonadaceae bacterium]|nr:lipid-transfer protein [Gemmatimonadaceae bacterium]
MSRTVLVAGVGMVPFAKPGKSDPYTVMASNAARAALADAGVAYGEAEQVYVGYVFGDSCAGQRAMYEVGLSGAPIINVNNNCATGSTALYLARQAVASGAVECALAVGFEQMVPGPLIKLFQDRPIPTELVAGALERTDGIDRAAPLAPQYFAAAGRQYMRERGIEASTFAKIAVKARQHAARNPFAIFRTPVTEEEVLASPMVTEPLTRLQCCPPTCGSAAAVLCSEEFARRHGIAARVAIAAQVMVTDIEGSFEPGNMMRSIGYDMAKGAAQRAYEAAGIGPEDVDVVELHDCFTANELIAYEALGLTPEGTAERFVVEGDNTFGGRVVTNPSGGLLSKGHPLGATGLAQCTELTWQLRGQAGDRQVEGARIALQHNLGLGGACVITLYTAR